MTAAWSLVLRRCPHRSPGFHGSRARTSRARLPASLKAPHHGHQSGCGQDATGEPSANARHATPVSTPGSTRPGADHDQRAGMDLTASPAGSPRGTRDFAAMAVNRHGATRGAQQSHDWGLNLRHGPQRKDQGTHSRRRPRSDPRQPPGDRRHIRCESSSPGPPGRRAGQHERLLGRDGAQESSRSARP